MGDEFRLAPREFRAQFRGDRGTGGVDPQPVPVEVEPDVEPVEFGEECAEIGHSSNPMRPSRDAVSS